MLAEQYSHITCYEVPKKKHAGINQIPKEHQHKKVVMNVRNTFDHYVSRYKFGWWAIEKNSSAMFDMDSLIKDYPHFPNLSFSEFMCVFNNWHYRRSKQVARHSSLLIEKEIGYNTWILTKLGLQSPKQFLSEFDEYSNDRLKESFNHIWFLRTERLNDDLVNLLHANGFSYRELKFIQNFDFILPKRGGRAKQRSWLESLISKSDCRIKRDRWQSHFDDAMLRDIIKKDRLYFRLFPDMLPKNEDVDVGINYTSR